MKPYCDCDIPDCACGVIRAVETLGSSTASASGLYWRAEINWPSSYFSLHPTPQTWPILLVTPGRCGFCGNTIEKTRDENDDLTRGPLRKFCDHAEKQVFARQRAAAIKEITQKWNDQRPGAKLVLCLSPGCFAVPKVKGRYCKQHGLPTARKRRQRQKNDVGQ